MYNENFHPFESQSGILFLRNGQQYIENLLDSSYHVWMNLRMSGVSFQKIIKEVVGR